MSELLFEIGCEELPPSAVERGRERLLQTGKSLAEALSIKNEAVVFGTPRRLVLALSGLPTHMPKRQEENLGPPAKVAWNDKGEPTKAAEGFAKGLGLPLSALSRKQTPKGEYAFATTERGGEPVAEVVRQALESTLGDMGFAKSMRWGNEEVRFARPVQWLLCVLSGKVLPLGFGSLVAQGLSRGHRFMAPEPFAAATLAEHQTKLAERFVVVDQKLRRQRVLEEVRRAAKEAGGYLFCDPEAPKTERSPLLVARYFQSLLEEVTDLCEQPFAIFGSFDKEALTLPREVVLTTMRAHQRYFAVAGTDGHLLPHFVTVAAVRVKDPGLVRRGNERVLKARLNDASYFFREDQKRSLAERIEDLKQVTYHKKLGTSHEKVARVLTFAFMIAEQLGKGTAKSHDLAHYSTKAFSETGELAGLGRAVALSKADLTTLMVGEFPELQGFIGAEYARRAGEREDVAAAIAEHYMPRAAEDELPKSELAALLALADKLDTVRGIIDIGQAPTGSSDPFALRRAALGCIRILCERGWPLSLPKLGLSEKSLAFIEERFVNLFLPEQPGAEANAVRAAVAAGFSSPAEALERVRALQAFAKTPQAEALAVTMKRVLNILKDKRSGGGLKIEGDIESKIFENAAERALHEELTSAQKFKRAQAKTEAGYMSVLARLAELRPAADAFFAAVMVMDKNENVKHNRLRLLRDVAGLANDIADFERL